MQLSSPAQIPSAYIDGHEKARALDSGLADAYVVNTLVGDPVGDAAMLSLADFDSATSHGLINAGMERDEEGMRDAPDALKEFFAELDRPPPFEFDPAMAAVGARAFYKHSDLFFVGLVMDSLVAGLSEGLSKGFYITGRTAGNLRRVRQNTR